MLVKQICTMHKFNANHLYKVCGLVQTVHFYYKGPNRRFQPTSVNCIHMIDLYSLPKETTHILIVYISVCFYMFLPKFNAWRAFVLEYTYSKARPIWHGTFPVFGPNTIFACFARDPRAYTYWSLVYYRPTFHMSPNYKTQLTFRF